MPTNTEVRLAEAIDGHANWKKWELPVKDSGAQSGGTIVRTATPGTISPMIKRVAYRWGEDGLAGISDDTKSSAFRRSGTAGIRF
jgi:hypothetical protein